MPNKEWDSATVEQKLEMLREDIALISDHHNALRRDFRNFRQSLSAEIEELKRNRPKT